MRNTRLVVHANRNLMQDSIDLYVTRVDLLAKVRSALELLPGSSGTFRFFELEDGLIGPPPPFQLSTVDAQQLMDDLYGAGLRPTDSKGTAGQVQAMSAHLEDMRSLVFKRKV